LTFARHAAYKAGEKEPKPVRVWYRTVGIQTIDFTLYFGIDLEGLNGRSLRLGGFD